MLECSQFKMSRNDAGNVETALINQPFVEAEMTTPDLTNSTAEQQLEYREIPLTQGQVALVDAEDFEFLNQWQWQASKAEDSFYAIRTDYSGAKKKTLRMHRVLLSAPKGIEVDHRNSNRLDNRRQNLRLATPDQNKKNRKPQPTKFAHGFKGISLVKRRWKATIHHEGKLRNIGSYPTPEMAALAYDFKARELYGEFARLNFPDRNEPMPPKRAGIIPPKKRRRGQVASGVAAV